MAHCVGPGRPHISSVHDNGLPPVSGRVELERVPLSGHSQANALPRTQRAGMADTLWVGSSGG